jgi:hypothetical protein
MCFVMSILDLQAISITKITVFCEVTTYSLVDIYRHFSADLAAFSFRHSFIPMMEVIHSSEMSVRIYYNT